MLSDATIKVAIEALEGERVHGASHMNSFQADAHRAKIDAALAELKSIRPQEMERVPDGGYDETGCSYGSLWIGDNGKYISFDGGREINELPPGWRLMRPRPQAQHRLAR